MSRSHLARTFVRRSANAVRWRVVRRLRDAALAHLLREFDRLQAWGVHVVPNHYYFPIPDTRTLDDSLWAEPSQMVGVDMRDGEQASLLSELANIFGTEFSQFPRSPTANTWEYFTGNEHFAAVDAEVLYSMVRNFKPRRLVEVGAGMSTLLMADAVRRNRKEGFTCRFVSYDPYPHHLVSQGVPGLDRFHETPFQEIPLEIFTSLEDGDILFVDSSHVLAVGSDVQRIVLDILPRLQRGVIVHFHDIFLPYEYPKAWVKEWHRFWTEQYVLQSFLAFNEHFDVLLCNSYLHARHPDLLQRGFPTYDPARVSPGSLWIRRVR